MMIKMKLRLIARPTWFNTTDATKETIQSMNERKKKMKRLPLLFYTFIASAGKWWLLPGSELGLTTAGL